MLIIGAGFLGAALFRLAGRTGWNARMADLRPGEPDVLPVDVADRESLMRLQAQGSSPDVVVLCASTNRGGVESYRAVFLEGARNIREAFPAARLIMCSSTSVYERTDGKPVHESDSLTAAGETAGILLEAEAVVLEGGGTVARLSNLYGPSRSVLLERILEGSAVIEGRGDKVVNHIHRDDAAAALLCLAGAEGSAGEIYNVTDDMPLEQKKLLCALAALFDKPVPPVRGILSDRKRAWTSKRVENGKLRALGWEPVYSSFLEAVPDLAPTMPGYEVREDEDEDELEEEDDE